MSEVMTAIFATLSPIALAIFILAAVLFGLVMAGTGIKARNESAPGEKHWPLAEHYEPEFASTLEKTGAERLMVKDC
jgi:hypothetical protein